MSCALVLTQSLDLTGGTTATVLPLVEAWLQDSADHWSALEFVAARKDMNRYRSVLDFLLCEICPEERAACLRYYADLSPRLVDLRSQKVIACHEARILVFLEVCYSVRCEERRLSWSRVLDVVDEIELMVTSRV